MPKSTRFLVARAVKEEEHGGRSIPAPKMRRNRLQQLALAATSASLLIGTIEGYLLLLRPSFTAPAPPSTLKPTPLKRSVASAPIGDVAPREKTKILPALEIGAHEYDQEILRLGLPAVVAMLADPLLSMIDTAYVGKLGFVSLAALGPCTSIFHLSFNMFRSLNQSTTTLVAQAFSKGNRERVRYVVFQAMALAVSLGIMVGGFLLGDSTAIISWMGAPVGSQLNSLADPYLRIRALAAPAVLLLMVFEGAYRGAGDTLTPLPITFLIAIVNLILDPILMFRHGMNLGGAALATVVAQYAGLVAYLALLFSGSSRSPITRDVQLEERPERLTVKKVWEDASHLLPLLGEILSANLNMLIRHATLLATWAVATAVATGIGTYEVAAHQVVLSIWLFCVLLTEGPAIAAQVLGARLHAALKPRQLTSLVGRLCQLGAGMGCGVGLLLVAARNHLPTFFTSCPEILRRVSSLLLVIGMHMPLVTLSLILEGLLVGCGKFQFLAVSSTLSSGFCALLLLSIRHLASPSVLHIWWAVTVMFILRVFIGVYGFWMSKKEMEGQLLEKEMVHSLIN